MLELKSSANMYLLLTTIPGKFVVSLEVKHGKMGFPMILRQLDCWHWQLSEAICMSTHGQQIMSLDVNMAHIDLFWVFLQKKFIMDLIAPLF